MSIFDSIDESELLYNTFKLEKALEVGGMGRILKVRAIPSSPGFPTFLASVAAWQEMLRLDEIKFLRTRIANLSRRKRDPASLSTRRRTARRHRIASNHPTERKIREELGDSTRMIVDLVSELKQRQHQVASQRTAVLSTAPPHKLAKLVQKLEVQLPKDSVYVVKQVLDPEDSKFVSRMEHEFFALKLLQHPNTIHVYALGPDYYVMEYLGGIRSADQLIPPYEELRAGLRGLLRILIEASKAVEHAHTLGIIHRDIKPQNIAVDKQGHVRLLDFGLAKSFESSTGTSTNIALGTPQYMSREQIYNTSDARPSFDIYGLGATLYEFLTCEAPYSHYRHIPSGEIRETHSQPQVFAAVSDDACVPVSPREGGVEIPLELEEITMKALAANSAQRYQTVTELREALEGFLQRWSGD